MSDSPHTPDRTEQRLLDAVKTSLDQSEQTLDGVTLGRLRAARREALGTLTTNHPRRRRRELLGGFAVAATLATLTVSLWILPPAPGDVSGNSLPALEDVALLTDAEELEFYQDLDFYLWLDSNGSDSNKPEPVDSGATERGGQALGGDQQTG
ncbi:MAG: DUF3619 family protein [Gammaproteobacteria bacterium]|nr:DUF3619 family protein [Gammaproteobacteria bacterium]